MNNKEKVAFTNINKYPQFSVIVRKLSLQHQLNNYEKELLLSYALLFIRHYEKDRRYKSYIEFAYFVILKYSITYRDYQPLFDISINKGYYPISRALMNDENFSKKITDIITDSYLNKFSKNGYVETYAQYQCRKQLLGKNKKEVAFIAPTSYGKSNIIVDIIRKRSTNCKRICIIVPTKSLLMQTYRMVKKAELNKRVLTHDEMYSSDENFISIFTQERALRLFEKNEVDFDLLFIDEAHNLLEGDSRGILLSRLVKECRRRNEKIEIVYLSPLLENVNNLLVSDEQQIFESRINSSIKEPEIFELGNDGKISLYNRFIGEFYDVGQENDLFNYIKRKSKDKNFVYLRRPVIIEEFSNIFSKHLPDIDSKAITDMVTILEKYIHEEFYVIELLKKGIVYIHGKLPDLLKEYLESKFKLLPELKYIIANTVILEGMNLPIDCLFILNVNKLTGKDLTNLIGRVNRLNSIFRQDGNDIEKLLPPVHFVNSDEYNRSGGNMKNKIKLLRSRIFHDEIKNPLLTNFDINKRPRDKEKNEQLLKKEEFLSRSNVNDLDKMKQYILEKGIDSFYVDYNLLTNDLHYKINALDRENEYWKGMPILDKIHFLFFHDTKNISDIEISRLDNVEARNFYEAHIKNIHHLSLKENIQKMFKYLKVKQRQENPLFFVGESYGEVNKEGKLFGRRLYVNLRSSRMSDKKLLNICIIKLKLEDSFISFKLNKFIVFLYDYGLISEKEYHKYIYGTTDVNKIALTKLGLGCSLLTRLDNDGQLKNLLFDSNRNVITNKDFENYVETIDDFYRFEIERIL